MIVCYYHAIYPAKTQKMINYKTAKYSCLQAATNAILSAVDVKKLKTLGGYAYESD